MIEQEEMKRMKRYAEIHGDDKTVWLIEQAEKAVEYEESLKTIIALTTCDDTWDFANRTIEGKQKLDLPYRFNNSKQ